MNEVSKAERPKRQRFSRRDFVAGLTNAITNIPDAMAKSAEPLPEFKWDLQSLKTLTDEYEIRFDPIQQLEGNDGAAGPGGRKEPSYCRGGNDMNHFP